MSTSLEQSIKDIKNERRLFLGLGVFSVFLAIFMAMFLSRIIAHPLVAISKMTEKIAAGDLTVDNLTIRERHVNESGCIGEKFSNHGQQS